MTAPLIRCPAGILGMGRGPMSLVRQLPSRTQHRFSYCLVYAYDHGISHLRFGNDIRIKRNAHTTGFLQTADTTFYHLDLQVTVKFSIPPTCEVSRLIVDLVSHLIQRVEHHTSGSKMIMRGDSAAAWQITLNLSGKNRKIDAGARDSSKDLDKPEGVFYVLLSKSLVGTEYCEIEFIKQGSFSVKELDSVVSALKLAGEQGDVTKIVGKDTKGLERDDTYNNASTEKPVTALEAMGVRLYGFENAELPEDGEISWDNIAGYHEQKREIEDTILLALQSPEVYDDIARGTRNRFETNRPRAVLFEGPPGTGKTSSARVIAKQAGVPLLYVPLEVIMSKYYGESEHLMGNVFSLANDLPKGTIVFLDEVDSFAIARDSKMHEATRRILSVLLRQIDGFEQDKRVVVIAATNRKQDLDSALIRMSGRDIRDVCQQAERYWASKLIRGQLSGDSEGVNLPPIEEYLKSADHRRKALSDADRIETPQSKKWHLLSQIFRVMSLFL